MGDDGDDRSLGAFLDRNIQGSIENHGGLLFQIVDATIVAAPKQRNTQEEKQALRDSRIPEEWKDIPRSSLRRRTFSTATIQPVRCGRTRLIAR